MTRSSSAAETPYGEVTSQLRSFIDKGCSPYGASTITGVDGKRQPSALELAGARDQGRHVAELAQALASYRAPAK